MVGVEMDLAIVDEKSSAVAALGQLGMHAPKSCLPRMKDIAEALEGLHHYAQSNVRF